MSLELDTRQRAMLQEMGVQVWLPSSGVAILEPAAPPARAPVQAGAQSAPVAAAARVLAPVATPPAAAERALPPQASPAAGAHAALPAAPPAPSAGASAGATTSPASMRPAIVPLGDAASPDWDTLTDAVRDCQACTLCGGRSHSTLLPPLAQTTGCDWMVVGDPPEDEEDRAGAPFTGPAGLLLDNMLRALGLQRANPVQPSAPAAPGAALAPERRAYVTNVLKCRPDHGAVPQAAELARCAAHLQREIALVQPRIILGLGRFANQLLLGATADASLPLGKLRGKLYRYQGIPVVLSYPPKLLMRNSADKAKAWADLCLAAATLA